VAKTSIVAEPGTPRIVITREFAASRDLLFRAHTDPDLLVQWLGPRHQTMTIDHFAPRHGGTWRYTSRDDSGAEHGFHGVFHNDPSPDGIVQTFEYEGWPGHVSLETLIFEERGDKTLLRAVSVFQSVEDRDQMIESGMDVGVNEGYDRLDEILAGLAQPR